MYGKLFAYRVGASISLKKCSSASVNRTLSVLRISGSPFMSVRSDSIGGARGVKRTVALYVICVARVPFLK